MGTFPCKLGLLNYLAAIYAPHTLHSLACSKRSDSGERCEVKKAMKSRGGLALAFIFSRFSLLRTAPHYLNAWNRLYTLGQKVLRFCTFLPIERLSRGFGTDMVPPLAPPWLHLFIRDQK